MRGGSCWSGWRGLGVATLAVSALSLPVVVLAAVDDPPPPADRFHTAGNATASATPIDFNNDVRPILAEHCLLCHGFDVSTRKAGLRLDTRAHAVAERSASGAAAIVPGDPAASLLLARITSDDSSFRMPPDDREPLPAAAIAVLRQWISEDAPYDQHWSFKPIEQPPTPAVDAVEWVRDDVDAFILAKLESHGLSPAPQADKHTLVRRVFFDLIGLPPTAEEIQAFVDDDDAQALARLVDRLLASPHFGERWARHWLDLVRYAETHGHEFDYPIRHAWQYRDYVIRALNADVPYDDFIREHVAGDLLDEPRRHPRDGYNESIIGTGWWWLSQATHAPVDVRADEAERVDNQIDVLSKTVLGLTVSCARCHDHKFDPITQRDYYALYGFVQSSRRDVAYLDPHGRLRAALDALLPKVAELDALVQAEVDAASLEEVRTYLLAAAAVGAAERHAPDQGASASGDREQTLDPERLAAWVKALADDPYPIESVAPLKRATDAEVFASFDGETYDGWFASGFAFGERPTRLGEMLGASTRYLVPGVAHSGRVASKLQGTLRSPTFELTRPYIHYRVRGRNTRIRLTIDGYWLDEFNALLFEPASFEVDSGDEPRWITHVQPILDKYIGHRAHIELLDEGDGWIAVDEITFSDRAEPFTPEAELATTPTVVACDLVVSVTRLRQRADVSAVDVARTNWLLANNLLAQPERETLGLVSAEVTRLTHALPEPMRVLAITDGTPENEHVFLRGNHSKLGDVVPRRFLGVLGADDPAPTSGSGRLELADRLVDAANPLSARVAVNRVWQHLFDTPLVPTPDDFGVLGESPTHAALLDHLATWFSGDAQWSTKQLIRRLVLSRTYQMSVVSESRALERDPDNTLLHRMRRKRLQGEALRDAILAVSGRLDRTVFGPPVPIHLTPFMQGRGRPGESGPLDGDGRRSIYIAVRRNFLAPMMLAFDTPVPHSTVGRRTVSNVPAQALILMNDPFVLAEARRWGERLAAAEERTVMQRLDDAYLAAFARPPTDVERAAALAFLRDHETAGAAADQAVSAWADLCHALFNVKEFGYLR